MDEPRKQIDTSVEIVTPENISFRYWLAGPSRRLPAYLIDVLIQVMVVVSAGRVLGCVLGSVGLWGSFSGLFLVILFLVHWFYGGMLEAVWNGQTPGKRAMRIRVVTMQGQPIRAWQAVLRNVLRAVDAMPLAPLALGMSELALPLFMVGFVAASLNDRFQRLGDLAAGTMVVVDGDFAHGRRAEIPRRAGQRDRGIDPTELPGESDAGAGPVAVRAAPQGAFARAAAGNQPGTWARRSASGSICHPRPITICFCAACIRRPF